MSTTQMTIMYLSMRLFSYVDCWPAIAIHTDRHNCQGVEVDAFADLVYLTFECCCVSELKLSEAYG